LILQRNLKLHGREITTFTLKYSSNKNDDKKKGKNKKESDEAADNNELDETYSSREELALSINNDATFTCASDHQHALLEYKS
jgi:hypothetical protein